MLSVSAPSLMSTEVNRLSTSSTPRRSKTGHDRRGVERRFGNFQRIIGEHILLRLVDIGGKAARKRQNEADADDADAPRHARDRRAPLLRQKVAPRQQKRRPEGHARLVLFVLFLPLPLLFLARLGDVAALLLRFGVVRVGIADDQPVFEFDDAGGILLRKFRVVRDHDDQPLPRDLLNEIHDLYARFGIERARRLVGEQNFGVVDERPRDRHALHLPARKLVRFFIQVLFQPHAPERLLGARLALLRRHARKGERQLHVAQNRLVRDEVIRLKNEPDAVVAVGVPVAVFVIFGGNALDYEVAARVVVEPADDVQKGRLSAARMTENGNELLAAETQTHALERLHRCIGDPILLGNVLKLQHCLCHMYDTPCAEGIPSAKFFTRPQAQGTMPCPPSAAPRLRRTRRQIRARSSQTFPPFRHRALR